MKLSKTLKTILSVIILVNATSCLKDDELNLGFTSYKPKSINDGHIISNPASENIDTKLLTGIYKDIYSDENLWSLRSMLVFRNGKLVAEAYLKDEQDITQQHLIWSCTKQVIGLLTGIALEKGLIKNIDDPISNYFVDELAKYPDKKSITIRNLINMQSGIDYNNDGVGGETDQILRQIPDNYTEFILARPMIATPGNEFHYNDGDPQLVSALIQKTAGRPTDQWANDVFFSKIGLTNYNWVRYKDGVTLGGFGIETTPRELAKIALCVANSGMWNGQQLVSNAWISDMTTMQVQPDHMDYAFGHYWWIDTDRDIHFMWGHGGQFAFIVPSKNIVVVMTSIPNTQGKYQILADEALPIVDRIISASN